MLLTSASSSFPSLNSGITIFKLSSETTWTNWMLLNACWCLLRTRMSCWWSTMSALFSTILHTKHHLYSYPLTLCSGSVTFWLRIRIRTIGLRIRSLLFASFPPNLFCSLLTIFRSHKTVEIKVFLKLVACWHMDREPDPESPKTYGPGTLPLTPTTSQKETSDKVRTTALATANFWVWIQIQTFQN